MSRNGRACTGIQVLWKCMKTFTHITYKRFEKGKASGIIRGCFVAVAIDRGGVVVGGYALFSIS